MDSQVLEVMGLDNEYKLFIGGKWVPASDGGKFTAYCAATGEKLAECAEATEVDVDAAVKAAQEAFPVWAAKMPAILNKIADAIEANIPRLAMIEAKDVSKPIRETTIIDIPTTADQFRYYAGLIRGEEGAVTKVDVNTIAKDVFVECFAPLTPRKVTEEDAKALLEKVFS